MKQLTGIALGFVLSVPATAGDVYQWVDDQGQVHFGDRPPLRAQGTRQPTISAGADAPAKSGLRDGERARLRAIEQRERRETADRKARQKRAAAEENRRVRQAERDARRCADYRGKIRDYQRKLRAGCRLSDCNAYEARIDTYQEKAARLCR